jgi:hypothetical protein
MKNKSLVSALVIASAVSLSGCATGAKFSETTQAEISEGKGRIVVYRTSIVGGGIQPIVNVNGVPTAKCQPNGVFTVDVPPGQVALSVETEKTRTSYVDVEAGKTSYVRCDPAMGLVIWQVKLTNVSATEGQAETGNLAVVGAF